MWLPPPRASVLPIQPVSYVQCLVLTWMTCQPQLFDLSPILDTLGHLLCLWSFHSTALSFQCTIFSCFCSNLCDDSSIFYKVYSFTFSLILSMPQPLVPEPRNILSIDMIPTIDTCRGHWFALPALPLPHILALILMIATYKSFWLPNH